MGGLTRSSSCAISKWSALGAHARADQVACPADFAPDGGLSGDRETATAQAVAECLRREGVRRAVADRTLPLIFAHEIQQAGIAVECDTQWGVIQRRCKDEQEIQWLQESQQATEAAMQMACQMVARAQARADGVLLVDGQPLTSERLRAAIDVFLLERGYTNPTSIIAGGPQGADCHDLGSGELRTEQPVIVDIFPRNRRTLYYGDCTRTVVHGHISDELATDARGGGRRQGGRRGGLPCRRDGRGGPRGDESGHHGAWLCRRPARAGRAGQLIVR